MFSQALRWARISVAATLSATLILGAMGAEASRTVTVGPTTTLDGLARQYGVSKKAIADANRIDVEAVLVDGRKLVIPDPPKPIVVPASMAASGTIIGNRISLRIGPSTDAQRLTLLDDGARVTVTARKGEWLQVKTATLAHAWVKSDFVQVASGQTAAANAPRVSSVAGSSAATAAKPRPVATSTGALRCIKGDRVALRKTPGTNGERLALMDDATPVKVVGKSGEWVKVRVVDGPLGWVRGDFVAERSRTGLTPSKVLAAREADTPRRVASGSSRRRTASSQTSTRSASSSSRTSGRASSRRFTRHSRPEPEAPKAGSDVVRTAYAYRGTRYRYGGSARGGFDCSGFTRYVYAQRGVELPHSSRAQYSTGKVVSKSSMKPGDLVFFSTTRRGISHVGIYVGDGKFVHASSARGRVRVDSLNSGYYSERFRGARRVK